MLPLRDENPVVSAKRLLAMAGLFWLVGSQRLHLCAALNVGWPFAWNDNLWSVKSPRSLLKQLSSGVKFDLIKDEDLSRDKPDCETDHQGA